MAVAAELDMTILAAIGGCQLDGRYNRDDSSVMRQQR